MTVILILPVVGVFCLKQVRVGSVEGRCRCSMSVSGRVVAHSPTCYCRGRSVWDLW